MVQWRRVSRAQPLFETLESRLLLDGTLPTELTVTCELPLSQGYYHTDTNTVDLSGTANAALTDEVLVGGIPATYLPWAGTWTTGSEVRLVLGDGPATYHVPTAGEDPDDWTFLGYPDDLWVSETVEGRAGLVLTEIETGDTDWVEIQNVSGADLDTTGWFVAVNNGSGSNINDVNGLVWNLPALVAADDVLLRTDDALDPDYWGADIAWDASGTGWAMIVDDAGQVVDFAAWGYTEAQIASLSVDVGGFTGVTVGGQWTGDGAGFVPLPGPQENVFAFGATWDYLHPLNATDPATTDPDFHTTWMLPVGYNGPAFSGPGPGILGFGTIDYGALGQNIGTPPSGSRYTAYFRRDFTLTADMVNAGFEILSDDGAFIYIDGDLVARNNILTGADTYTKMADGATYPNGENTEQVTRTLSLADLEAGDHTIAVSVHQSGTTSSDLGFAMRLFGQPLPAPGTALARTGHLDGDAATDFAATDAPTPAAQNPDLTVPFGVVTPVTMGLGFSGGAYDAYVATDVSGAMGGTSASLWTRVEFQAPDLTGYDGLALRLRYDDGFVAYLNGEKVAEANAPAVPAWDSAATDAHDGTSLVEIDLSAYLGDVFAGDNVLAIHGLNLAASDPDFLIQAELVATRGTPGSALTLAPGINRVLVQALDAGGEEIERTQLDIWYDTGAYSDQAGTLPAGTTTWTAEAGPYRLTGNVTVPTGATLVIEPGTTVFFNAGTYMTINGKLDAQGAEYGHIRMTVTPGGANWAGLRFSGGTQPSLISYADIEYSSGSDSIDASSTAVHLDHITWAYQGSQYYLDWHNASIILTNSILPFIPSHELIHFAGFPADGYALVQGNWIGGTTGYNDIIDLTGGNRPGPIVRFIGNVFAAGSDDVLDLDSTDAHIEGNVFMHIHQDGTRDSKSFAISTGQDNADTSQLTVVGNLFYDVDHAMLSKGNGFITAVNNTIVDVHAVHANATSAVISFYEIGRGQPPGVGAYFDSNIMYNVSALWENLDADGSTTVLTANRNVIYNVGTPFGPLPGVDNLLEDPMLVNPDNVTDPWKDFMLQSGSPALGTGFNGVDIGGVIPYGASIAGEPDAVTTETAATLTIGGLEIYGYKYRVMKDGEWLSDWSAEVPHPAPNPPSGPIPPITPIVLTDLEPGTYRVAVVRKDTAGYWQGEDEATLSRAWTVVVGAPNVLSVRLNDRPGRSASAIEPSGIGVRTVGVTFSEPVWFGETAVTLETVTFPAGVELIGEALVLEDVTGSGTDTMTITVQDAWQNAVDTWVKVTLGSAGITDVAGNGLDGNPRTDSSGMGYIRDADLDLPTGDGLIDDGAIFYVGSLRGDMWGVGFGIENADPDGQITLWDINGFTSKYQEQDPDADLWGLGFSDAEPDGAVTLWDINAFTTFYQEAVANGTHLDELPTLPAPSGEPALAAILPAEPVALPAEKPVAVAGEAIEELRLLAASQPLPDGEAGLYTGQDETSPDLEPAMAAALVGLGELPLAAGLEIGLTTSADAQSSAPLYSGASLGTAMESSGVTAPALVPDGELVDLLALSVVALPLTA